MVEDPKVYHTISLFPSLLSSRSHPLFSSSITQHQNLNTHSLSLALCFWLIHRKRKPEEMLRSVVRAATTHHSWRHKPTTISSLNYSSKAPKPAPTSKPAAADLLFDEQERLRRLAADEKDPSLDVGPDGRPLFSSATSISKLTGKDSCTYFKLTYLSLSLCVLVFQLTSFRCGISSNTLCALLIWPFFWVLLFWVGLIFQKGGSERGSTWRGSNGYGEGVSGLHATCSACSPELLGSSW